MEEQKRELSVESFEYGAPKEDISKVEVYDVIPCTPQHSVNGHVPAITEFEYHGKVCDCGKLIWGMVNICGCPAQTAVYELQARPNV